jgi:DNA-binding protein HU-beta
MNQSELVDKVVQKTTLTQSAAAEAVKAVVQAVLESLVAGEPVRVFGLGTFNVAARSARDGRNPQTGESIKIPASKAVRFHAGKTVKDALNPPRALATRSLRDQRDPSRRSKQYPAIEQETPFPNNNLQRPGWQGPALAPSGGPVTRR